jgi:hypothetical protein
MSFFRQPVSAYRDFQIVFTLLTLNFAIPTLGYVFAPELAAEQFRALNLSLGGADYSVPEASSHFWRYLGAANVGTLAFMCMLLQLDLDRFAPVLVPLCFMKGLAATLWLAGYLEHPEWPAFLAAAVLDYATTFAFAFFARRAQRALVRDPVARLVPRPLGRA